MLWQVVGEVVKAVVLAAVVLVAVGALAGCQGPRVAWVTGCESDGAAAVVKGVSGSEAN